MKIFYLLPFFIELISCSTKNECPRELIMVDHPWLDSIRKTSDTSFVKKYRNKDFVSSEYFINKKDSVICQVMKDSVGNVRQIILAKKDRRIFFGEYFQNGQLKAKLPLDIEGKYDGLGKYYYESGCIKSTGHFKHGFYTGTWKSYNNSGRLISIEEYDSNGQMTKKVSQ